MRKLKLQVQISVDGYSIDAEGQLDWMTFQWDDKLKDFVSQLTDSCDAILLGKNMTTEFVNGWESVQPGNPEYDFAQRMVNYPKFIFSKTLDKPIGKNASLVKGNLAEEIAKIKNQSGKDIIVYGGPSFVSSLIQSGHIDEFYFFVNPIMIGDGRRIFDLLDHRQKLSLISSTAYECGVTVLRYILDMAK